MDIWLLLLMLMVLSAKADSKDKHCVDVKQNGRQKMFKVSCKEKCAVISNIAVTAGTGNCSGNAGCCEGESPNLIVESLNCYWKHSCFISFPRDSIIKLDNECPNCIGKQPTSLIINQAKCFTPKTNTDGNIEQDKVNICEHLNSNKESDVSMVGGLLLSHESYPWEYEPSKTISPQDPNLTCNKTFWLNADTKFLVSVYKIDVAEEDSLWVITDTSSKEIRNEISFVFDVSQTRYVGFEFNVDQESNGGMGFVLCFKMIPTRDYRSDMNACDIVMNRSAAIKVRKADADCTRTWLGFLNPSPNPPRKKGRRCRKPDRIPKQCRNRKKKPRDPKTNKKKNKDRRKKKENENGSKSSEPRQSR